MNINLKPSIYLSSGRIYIFLLILGSLFQVSCSAIKTPITHQYTLNAWSQQRFKHDPSSVSILINSPEAVAGLGTEQMLYLTKPYERSAFSHNAWTNPPADLMFPLIINSLQSSGYFFAVASTSSSESTDYRLDTQLLTLQQNFIDKPSVLEFSAKVVLTKVSTNHIIASRIIQKRIPCAINTPYAGVIAANKATQQFTAEMTQFVIKSIRADR